jgi:hypothetical protein
MIQEKIEMIIIMFLGGWMFTSILSKMLLLTKQFKLINYVCPKCITFWGSLLICVFMFNIQDAILIALVSAFLAEMYSNYN